MDAATMFVIGAIVLGLAFAWLAHWIGREILRPSYSWVTWLFAIEGAFTGAKASGLIVKHVMGIT